MKLTDIINLLRIRQWYKNLVVFIPLIFSHNLTNTPLLAKTILGFFVLCIISSSYYITNDIIDRKTDAHLPDKKRKPIATGVISVPLALLLLIILAGIGLYCAYKLSTNFFILVIVLYAISNIYSLLLKRIMFLDIITIGINFLLKTISGAILIRVTPSHWLIMLVFFFALMLASGKRIGEIKLGIINKKRPKYNINILSEILLVCSTLLLAIYMLYNFQGAINIFSYLNAIIVVYGIFQYYSISKLEHHKIRNPEYLLIDKRVIIPVCLWVIINLFRIYIYRLII